MKHRGAILEAMDALKSEPSPVRDALEARAKRLESKKVCIMNTNNPIVKNFMWNGEEPAHMVILAGSEFQSVTVQWFDMEDYDLNMVVAMSMNEYNMVRLANTLNTLIPTKAERIRHVVAMQLVTFSMLS